MSAISTPGPSYRTMSKKRTRSTSNHQIPTPKKAKTSPPVAPRTLRIAFCQNCGCGREKTKLWRSNPDPAAPGVDNVLCNACGIWRHDHGTSRPRKFWQRGPKSLDASSEGEATSPKVVKSPKKKRRMSREVVAEPDAMSVVTEEDEDEVEAAKILMAMSEEAEPPVRRRSSGLSVITTATGTVSEENIATRLFNMRPSHFFNPPPPLYTTVLLPQGHGSGSHFAGRGIDPTFQLPTPIPSPPTPRQYPRIRLPTLDYFDRQQACCPSSPVESLFNPSPSVLRVSNLLASPEPIERKDQFELW
ncbi:hypothetical protein CI109_106844 [Kwoniella shandongensis]|uniref:Uncharacterized protein n=1 Tax=Kwoniella shandongensis TaxID=1734106 RepID=A0A5M6C7R1_9TREE|nr:uncharacterized protein CI109_000900 [Kwoniella shandongensis]KAA5530720.1 hypothetical protein CI109_000900 [Kwoniella shandongensis]